MKQWPFRIGTTSYIIPDDILPNVKFLADKVDDVELVLFEVDDGPNNMPTARTIQQLKILAQQHQMSYTVHLPLDLRLAAEEGEQHISMLKARKVIDSTRDLDPWAYVLHLDGKELLSNMDPDVTTDWIRQAVRALNIAAEWVGDGSLLAVENLEKYPLNFYDEVFKQAPISRCIDIGHLWVDGYDPITYLINHIDRAKVLHIHGISERDHKSLSHVPFDELYRVIRFITHSGFRGVMTVEVFGEEDFQTSMLALQKVMDRLTEEE